MCDIQFVKHIMNDCNNINGETFKIINTMHLQRAFKKSIKTIFDIKTFKKYFENE